MRTRTLLLLAVAVGLVILVAGSVKLFLISDDEPTPHLLIGQSGTIGDMTATVESVERAGVDTVARVRLIGVDDADGATTWVYVTAGTELRSAGSTPAGSSPCGATQSAAPVECALTFHTDRSLGVLKYERGGATLIWDVDVAG